MASALLLAITIATIVSSTTKVESCPKVCKCTEETAMCASAGLQRIPENLPQSIRTLNLSHNALTNMDNLSLYHSLVEVYLDHNEITALPHEFSPTLFHLEILSLHWNHIRELSPSLVLLPNLHQLHLSHNNIGVIDRDTTSKMKELRILDLSHNQIEAVPSEMLKNSPHLKQLDLGYNSIRNISSRAFDSLDSLTDLSLQHNEIRHLSASVFHSLHGLHKLDLSINNLQSLDREIFAANSQLRSLSLQNNHISHINPSALSELQDLSDLDLSGNDVPYFTGDVFRKNSNLTHLNLSYSSVLDDIHWDAFQGLLSVKSIDLSHSPNLQFVHRDLFLPCLSLQVINISYSGFQNLYYEAVGRVSQLQQLHVQGNPLECSCAIRWMKNSSLVQNLPNLTCHDISINMTLSLDTVQTQDLNCTGAQITNHTKSRVFFKLGAPGRLVCEASGFPSAAIVWTTPSGRTFIHNDPWVSNVTHHHVANESFHEDHHWHDNTKEYFHDIPLEHTHLLQDGSLYIDYVTRAHAGKYTCTARNIAGNDTTVIVLRLNYTKLYEIQKMGLLVGASCAIGFLILSLSLRGIQLAAKRCCARYCRKTPPEERKGIRQILDNLDAYRTEKMDRLREGYNNQMGKIRDIKDQCSHQVEKMRDNYHSQIARIKENCSQQMERLRENYHAQLGRLKGYKSSKLIKIRENYGAQKAKIREYGVQQLKKLHENYKLQQQHLIKILETMNLDHCKGVIEAECVRTESMLFNADQLLDPSNIDTPDDLSEPPSEYMTAVSASFSDRDISDLQEYDTEDKNSTSDNSESDSQEDHQQQIQEDDIVIEVDSSVTPDNHDHIMMIDMDSEEGIDNSQKESPV
ncbi:leucine-rich repeat neuronal protein 1 [Lingula anatina]|uniref:Leucine-rich repeat neuronal protein 1 n=1 Tax=Lingula anatina TaxID=7574 RepID=A0A1S3HPC8_LINAN|nr:leucine-rich repeat neuronal protein 1 [Lingula anatina]XP_013387397.1 leucine-rich repeat neuronal protein 1 [Lingula anatina]|eukprot:XP_013387396.1 leucine-rich repeat neuronal protein 1 [Lingula anatina]